MRRASGLGMPGVSGRYNSILLMMRRGYRCICRVRLDRGAGVSTGSQGVGIGAGCALLAPRVALGDGGTALGAFVRWRPGVARVGLLPAFFGLAPFVFARRFRFGGRVRRSGICRKAGGMDTLRVRCCACLRPMPICGGSFRGIRLHPDAPVGCGRVPGGWPCDVVS